MNPSNINSADEQGATALHFACAAGDTFAAELLLCMLISIRKAVFDLMVDITMAAAAKAATFLWRAGVRCLATLP